MTAPSRSTAAHTSSTSHVSRRNFMQMLTAGSAAALFGLSPSLARAAGVSSSSLAPYSGEGTNLTAEEALQKLIDGNARYLASKQTHPDQTTDRRIEVAKAQTPFAVILTCSDSRVAPELLFDQGLGDLFVLRTAGNVLADVVTGSIEYAVEHLGVPLIMVLGHERCGAVTAAVDLVTKGTKQPGHIEALADAIKPAVEKIKNDKGDIVDNAVRANAVMGAEILTDTEPILSEAVKAKKLMIVAARYDLDDGKIEMLTA